MAPLPPLQVANCLWADAFLKNLRKKLLFFFYIIPVLFQWSVPVSVSGTWLSLEIPQVKKEAGSLTNWPTGIASENTEKRLIYIFFEASFTPTSPIHPAPLYNSKKKKPWQASRSVSLRLVICGFRAPTQPGASKGASGKCHFKLHVARKMQEPS